MGGLHRYGYLWTPVDVLPVRTLSDESLLAGLGSGDPKAASAFVRRFQARVYGLTLSILGDRGAAEEAAQETFVRAWRYAPSFDSRRGAVPTWLLTIARNVSIDMLPRRRVDPIDPDILVTLERMEDLDDDAARFAESSAMREALAQLPEEQRRVLILSAVHGYSAREMSEMDGVPLGTVKTRIRAGMMKLRSEVGVPDES